MLGVCSQSEDVFAQQSADNSACQEREAKQPRHITPRLAGRLPAELQNSPNTLIPPSIL